MADGVGGGGLLGDCGLVVVEIDPKMTVATGRDRSEAAARRQSNNQRCMKLTTS